MNSQIFRYIRSIFCLRKRPKFSDFFDLCLHWVSERSPLIDLKPFGLSSRKSMIRDRDPVFVRGQAFVHNPKVTNDLENRDISKISKIALTNSSKFFQLISDSNHRKSCRQPKLPIWIQAAENLTDNQNRQFEIYYIESPQLAWHYPRLNVPTLADADCLRPRAKTQKDEKRGTLLNVIVVIRFVLQHARHPS